MPNPALMQSSKPNQKPSAKPSRKPTSKPSHTSSAQPMSTYIYHTSCLLHQAFFTHVYYTSCLHFTRYFLPFYLAFSLPFTGYFLFMPTTHHDYPSPVAFMLNSMSTFPALFCNKSSLINPKLPRDPSSFLLFAC